MVIPPKFELKSNQNVTVKVYNEPKETVVNILKVDNATQKPLAGATLVIKGGTFGFNPTEWVAEGYVAVKNGNTWTVSK